MSEQLKSAEIEWRDGLPYSPRFDDVYFSDQGGLDESVYVFIEQNRLDDRFCHAENFIVAETGFGSGLNFIATCRLWLESAPEDALLTYIGIEKYPVRREDLKRFASMWPELSHLYRELIEQYPLPVHGTHALSLYDGRVRLILDQMDIEQALTGRRYRADAWFLDGFDPRKNRAMWDERVFEAVARNSRVGTTLSTYTVAGAVRRGLTDVGFEVKKSAGFGKKREMLTAQLVIAESGADDAPWYDIPLIGREPGRAVVIGSGLAGLSVSRELLARGWDTTLIDRHSEPATGASGNPAGILSPRFSAGDTVEEAFYTSAFFDAVKSMEELVHQNGGEFWHPTGVRLILGQERAQALIDRFPLDAFLSEEGEASGSTADDGSRILLIPLAGWVQTKALCEVMFNSIRDRIKHITGEVSSLKREDDVWRIDMADGGSVETDVVIIASGECSHRFRQTEYLKLTAVRGQVTEVRTGDGCSLLELPTRFGHFAIPVSQDRIIVGATYQRDDTDTAVRDIDQSANLDALRELLPDEMGMPEVIGGRAAIRCTSEDRFPVVGQIPDADRFDTDYAELHHGRRHSSYPRGRYHEGLYISTAHGSYGLSSCMLSGKIIASMIEGVAMPVSRQVMDRLNPARFLIRSLKRNRGGAGRSPGS